MTNSTPKSNNICTLVSLSTVERFRGAKVEFLINFVSWPVYTTIPKIHEVFLKIAPLSSNWSGPRASGLKKSYDFLSSSRQKPSWFNLRFVGLFQNSVEFVQVLVGWFALYSPCQLLQIVYGCQF